MSQLQMHFYNTISLTDQELKKEIINAINQEDRIYYLFQIYREGTPSEMMKRYDKRWPSIPLTSIRRSLTNLTKEGRLVMTDKMLPGLYNKPEHLWELRE
jgi:tRNA(Leu) C34 or U34 (ribose-2'-O)-methylase TrmL